MADQEQEASGTEFEQQQLELELRRLALEERKHDDDVRLREREYEFQRRRRLVNPVTVGLLAAAIGLFGNILLAYLNAKAERAAQEQQAEYDRILAAMRSGELETTKANFRFLIAAELVAASPSLLEAVEGLGTGTTPNFGQGPSGPPTLDQMLSFVEPLPEAQEGQLRVMTLNVASGHDTDPSYIAREMALYPDIHIWGLTEVGGEDDLELTLEHLEYSTGRPHGSLLGSSGYRDRIAIVWDTTVVRQVSICGDVGCEPPWSSLLGGLDATEEYLRGLGLVGDDEESRKALSRIDARNTRRPVVAEFRHLASGRQFSFVVNHFQRRDQRLRQMQAALLREYARRGELAALPAIGVGALNLDWDVDHVGDLLDGGNVAFRLLFKDSPWTWLRPEPLVPTTCSTHFRAIVDFIVVAGGAETWATSARVLNPSSSYCERYEHGFHDHRPVFAVFEPAKQG